MSSQIGACGSGADPSPSAWHHRRFLALLLLASHRLWLVPIGTPSPSDPLPIPPLGHLSPPLSTPPPPRPRLHIPFRHPEEHNWAIPFTSRINKDSIYQHLLTYGLIFLTWVINQQPATHRYYDHLNAKYGSWNMNFYGTLLITTGVYWLIGFFFMALDMNPTLHSYVKKYKIQPDRTITWAEYRQVCFVAAKNLLLVNVPITWLTATFRPLDTRSSTLPTLWQTTWVYFACMICEEAGFFFVHRAVHSPKLYARFHKMHHQFTAPVAFASTYCTLFEQTFVSQSSRGRTPRRVYLPPLAASQLAWSSLTSKSNLGPVVLGIILINPHWCQLILFFSSLEIGTLTTQ